MIFIDCKKYDFLLGTHTHAWTHMHTSPHTPHTHAHLYTPTHTHTQLHEEDDALNMWMFDAVENNGKYTR